MMQHISEITTGNKNPNLTIVLPGPCQAKCSFCNWKQDDKIFDFLKNLEKLLYNLPKNFRQISISGGEPTLSPVFKDAIELIGKAKDSGKLDKVVLTTNGVNLNFDYSNLMTDIVDHVNISRHHYHDIVNQKIFNTTRIPNATDIQMIIKNCNKNGIDVNFNCVFTKENSRWKRTGLKKFIRLAKEAGASSIAFRNQYDNFEPSILQGELELNYRVKSEQSCPVCFTKVFLVDGLPIKFHHSSYEPTENKSFDKNETYELILHGNGTLSRDWACTKEVSLDILSPKISIVETDNSTAIPEKIGKCLPLPTKSTYIGCGSSYTSCGDVKNYSPKPCTTYSSCGGSSYSSCD